MLVVSSQEGFFINPHKMAGVKTGLFVGKQLSSKKGNHVKNNEHQRIGNSKKEVWTHKVFKGTSTSNFKTHMR